MRLPALNQLPREEFVAELGAVFEHSPWVAEQAWARRPFASVNELHTAMKQSVQAAGREFQLALIRAHPDLGTRVKMAKASLEEQAGVGLDQLRPEEFEYISRLNQAYTQRFGFPFIFAIKGKTKQDVFASMEQRIHNDVATEFKTALEQIYKIALFRLIDMVQG